MHILHTHIIVVRMYGYVKCPWSPNKKTASQNVWILADAFTR